MSTSTPEQPPADDSKVASIAWAVAVIVVAVVVGLIAWLALGQEGGGSADAPASPPAATESAAEEDAAEEDAAATAAPETDSTTPEAQTPPPEVVEMMLALQRRDADDPMATGDVDAPVVMIEYADYRCPYCARFALETRPELQGLVDDGTLRIEFRDFVIFDEQSHMAAVAARAAAEQDLLEPYQEVLFGQSTEGHAELTREDLVALAEEVEVPDLEAFEESLDDPELAAAVDADTAEARSIGLRSTPTFLVNTAVVQGAETAAYFRDVIEQELERASVDG